MRASALDQKFTAQTFVAIADKGQDPCDLRVSAGDTALVDLVASRVPLFEFVIKQEVARFNIDKPEGQAAAREKILPVLRAIRDKGTRWQYVTTAARLLGYDPGGGDGDIHQLRRDVGSAVDLVPRVGNPGGDLTRDPVVKLEYEVIKALLQRPGIVGPRFNLLQESDFTDSTSRTVYGVIANMGGTAAGESLSPASWVDLILKNAPNDVMRSRVAGFAVEPLRTAYREPGG